MIVERCDKPGFPVRIKLNSGSQYFTENAAVELAEKLAAIGVSGRTPAETVSREAIDINGHEVESAVNEAWESNAVDSLGVEQRSMTYREFVTAGYQIAKALLTPRLPTPQPVSTGEVIGWYQPDSGAFRLGDDAGWSAEGYVPVFTHHHAPTPVVAVPSAEVVDSLSCVREKLSIILSQGDWGPDSAWCLKDLSWCISELDPTYNSSLHAHLLATTKQAPDVEAVVEAQLIAMFRAGVNHQYNEQRISEAHGFRLDDQAAERESDAIDKALSALKNGGKP